MVERNSGKVSVRRQNDASTLYVIINVTKAKESLCLLA